MSVFNNLENTNMTVSVIDKNKCTASFTYQPFDPMLVIPAAQNAACGANGKINVTVTGGNQPYQYSLNNVDFQSSPVFENLDAGTYTVTVKDAFNCTASAEATMEREEYEISLSVTSENPTCGADGVINMEATGGRGTYQYSIDGGSTWGSNSTVDDLCPGTYGEFKVKDAGGCEATAESITLTAPEFIELVTPDGPPVMAMTDPQARAAADEDGVIVISYKGKEYRVKVPNHEKVAGNNYDIKVNNIVYSPLFIECSETFAGYYRVDCPEGSGELSKKEDFEGVNCIGNLPLKHNGKDVYKDCWLDDIEKVFEPYIIAKTRRRPGLADNLVDVADDMKHGDYSSIDRLIELNLNFRRMLVSPYFTDPDYTNPNVLLEQWKDVNNQATSLDPEMRTVANTMAELVFSGNGSSSQSFSVLNQRAEQCTGQNATSTLVDRIKTSLEFELSKDADFISKKGNLRLVTNGQYNSEQNVGSDGVLRRPDNIEIARDDIPSPTYGSNCSYGFAIVVNDTWAHDIMVTKADVDPANRTYSITLDFTIYDHYGLNTEDIDPVIKPEFADDFRFLSWFLLQRWHLHNKKPFITELKFTKTINGTF
jgi:hypothetical protein